MNGVRLAAIEVSGDPDRWSVLGFALDADGRIPLTNAAVVPGAGRMALVVDTDREVPDEIDGVPTRPGGVVRSIDHPNGAIEVDHVVLMTNSIERTSAAIASGLGLEQRRIRETSTVRQAFHRFDDHGGSRGCIVEVVENQGTDGSALWGLVVNVADLDAACRPAPDLVGDSKPAVQSGRRIATVRREAGLGTAVALMSLSAG